MTVSYQTIQKPCTGEIQSKQSKFIGLLIPVATEMDVRSALVDLKKNHPKANHICYGYRIQEQLLTERMSDDGEPAATAGLPILEVLRRASLENVLGAVVRYFGGTLLGTGGLIRAYTKGIQAALLQAQSSSQIVEVIWMTQMSVEVAYTWSGKLDFELQMGGYHRHEPIYTDLVTYRVDIPLGEEVHFHQCVTTWTNGTGVVAQLGQHQVIRPI